MQTTHYWPWQPFMFGSSILQDHHYDRGRFNIIDVVNRRLTAASTHTTDTMNGHVVVSRVDSPLFREGLPNHVEDSVTSMAGVPLRRRWYVSTCILKEDCSGDPIRAVVPTHYWIKRGRQLNSHASTLQQEAKSFIREPHTRPPERLSQVNQHVWLPPRSNVF